MKNLNVAASPTAGALFGALLLALAPALAAPAVADQHATCADPGIKKITVLGLSPVSKQKISGREEMARYLAFIRPAIETIMTKKGQEGYTDRLFQALESGDGVTEAEFGPGRVIEWMIFRREGYIAVGRGPYCVDTPRSYEAFQVELVDEEDLGDAVRTTTTTFIIPKICANLALASSKTETVDKPQPKPVEPPPVAPPSPPEPPKPPDVVPPPPAPPPPPPAPERPRWTIRGFGLRMDVDDSQFSADGGPIATGPLSVAATAVERTDISVGGGNGAGFNIEYRPRERFGLEGGLLYSELDSLLVFDSPTEWLMDHDSSGVLVLTFGPNFHLTPGKKADFYIGPFIGLARLDDPSYDLGGTKGTVRTNYDDEFVIGGQLGLDIPFGGSGWAFHLGALYMKLGAGEGGVDLDLNPLTGTVGLAYDF